MTVSYQREKLSDLWDEAYPLLLAHWREIAKYQDITLDPDIESYTLCEQNDMLRVYTARNDGGLVGYAAFFVRANPHYRQSLQAVQDVLYLAPRHRAGFTGIKLIKFADRELAKEGVQVVMHHVKAAYNFGPVLERMGYSISDIIYTKRLDYGSECGNRLDRGSSRSSGQQEDEQEIGGSGPRRTATATCDE